MTLQRRRFVAALACCSVAAAGAQDEPQVPRQKISAATLFDALSQRFPVRFSLEGLFTLQLDAQALLLLPERQRLGATLRAQLAGVQLPQGQAGELDAVFALRYEASDRSVRGRELEILALRWPGLPPETAAALQALLPRLAREAVGEVVLHRFTPRELTLPDTMGLEPRQLTIVEDGLVVGFAPRQRN